MPVRFTLAALLLPAAALAAIAAAPAAAAAPATSAACTTWQAVPSPAPAGSELNAVAASGPKDVWAVGFHDVGGAFKNLIEHWNGSTWKVVPSPNPASGKHTTNALDGVVALSRSNAWAFGFFLTTTTTFRTLILHWNGTKWSVVPSPNVGAENTLASALALSPTDIWAVGYHNNPGHRRTLAEHWNGMKWSVVPTPNVGTGDNFLFGAAAAPDGTVWAVGTDPKNFNRTLAMSFTGTWSLTPTVDPGDGDRFLQSVTAPAAGFALTVGSYLTGQQTRSVAEAWNGASWSVVPTANPGADVNFLQAVVATSPTSGWAVGMSRPNPGASFRALAERWNGSRFTQVAIPSPGPHDDQLFGLTAVPKSGGFWAVGNAGDFTLTEFHC